MQKIYIILAHENPQQLNRLISKLNDSCSFFYVHIDLKTDIKAFSNVIKSKNLKFITNRIEGIWGDFNLVQATINCLQEVKMDAREGYCILMSGQDYPLKSNTVIHNYLEEHKDYDFIDLKPINEVWSPNELKLRTQFYKFNLSNKKGDYVLIPFIFSKDFYFRFKYHTKAILKLLTKAEFNVFRIFKKRKHPFNYSYFGGSQWWALTSQTVFKILELLEKKPELINFYRFTLIPDELFFQTILKNLSVENYTTKVLPSLTYVNWSRTNCTLPVTFTINDYNELKNIKSNKIFARKFNIKLDQKILDKLDDDNYLIAIKKDSPLPKSK
ncbi:core-2/I-Branching enzyme [Flavobacteriaceae bacterium MAR_2010_105]|nr:core-2/I-Branching enzyme [Flavobacteriaceae bacterium MAR_2010_105]